MRSIGLVALLVAAGSPVHAQLGPTEARPVMGQLGPKPPAQSRSGQEFATQVEVTIGADGFVKSVDVLESSGNPSFDENVQRYFMKRRMVPAIDADGRPYESRLHLGYGAMRSTMTIPVTSPTRPPRPAQSNDIDQAQVLSDAERIPRMSCKDFLWEYEIVTSVRRDKLAPRDPLLQTPLVLFVAEAKLTDQQIRQMDRSYGALVRDVAERCRGEPQSPFWSAVMRPALQGALKP